MKIAAVIDESRTPGGAAEGAVYEEIKKQRGADALIVVTSGNFCQDGSVSENNKYKKAELLRAMGADLVLELPVYCTLTSLDTFAFAAVSMLEKLNCVDELIVFTENVEEKLLRDIVQFLFIESGEYQAKVKKCRAAGVGFMQAQAEVTEAYIPGAGSVLLCETNRKAAEYLKAVKRLYSTMKPGLYDLKSREIKDAGTQEQDSAALAAVFDEMISQMEGAGKEKYLNEIAGGYEPKTKKLLDVYQANGITDFDCFAGELSDEKRTVSDVRRYLLRTLIGIRQVDISICGLYSYAIYARALGVYKNCPVYEKIKETSWIPVFSEQSPEDEEAEKADAAMDDSGRILTAIDRRAGALYSRIKNNKK